MRCHCQDCKGKRIHPTRTKVTPQHKLDAMRPSPCVVSQFAVESDHEAAAPLTREVLPYRSRIEWDQRQERKADEIREQLGLAPRPRA